MPPFALALLALAFSIEESLFNVAGKITDVRRAGEVALEALGTEGGNVEQQQPPASPPVLPVPRAGDLSEEYAERFPPGLPCTVAGGLKYDPWRQVEVNGVYQLGGWIPVDADFTAPVV